MGVAETTAWFAARATHELALFAAFGIALGGVDDLLVDLIWLLRTMWRRTTVYTRHPRANAQSLAGRADGRVAVLVPAWREASVIGPMLRTALSRWGNADYCIYVGCYPNDPDSIAAVRKAAARTDRVRLVINTRPGGTTKGDNLNVMWRALIADEQASGVRFTAIALHDVEDVVHPRGDRDLRSPVRPLRSGPAAGPAPDRA
jgi:bacteriophage N4 adsorption protein B